MIQSTQEIEIKRHNTQTRTCTTREFSSFWDFVRFTKNTDTHRTRRLQSEGTGHFYGSKSINGTESFDSAVEVAEKGWSEGATKMRELIQDVKSAVNVGTRPRVEMQTARAGAVVDVPAYLRGEPNHMRRPEKVGHETNGETIKIHASFGASCGIDASTLMMRGAMIGSVVLMLEHMGYPVELWAENASNYDHNKSTSHRIQIKDADGYLNESVVAFALAHPCMLRRLEFRSMEAHEDPDICNHGVYGYPADRTDHGDGVFYGTLKHDRDARPYANAHRQLKRGDAGPAVEWVCDQVEEITGTRPETK